MENDNFDIETSIDQSEKFLHEQFDSVKNIKDHQKSLLSSVSIIIAVSTLIIKYLTEEIFIDPLMIFGLGALFAFMVVVYSFSIMPVELQTPIKISYKIFEKIFFNKSKKEILENKLRNYVDVIDNNELIIKQLMCRSKISTTAYLIILATLFYLFCKFYL